MVKTCLNTPSSNISLGVPPFQATIIMAYIKTKNHYSMWNLRDDRMVSIMRKEKKTITEWKYTGKSNEPVRAISRISTSGGNYGICAKMSVFPQN
jgi:hypothetical protein